MNSKQKDRHDPLAGTSGTLAVFMAADKLYATPAELVKEVVNLPEVSPLEDSAEFVIGVVNVRGRVVPVIDLFLRLGRKPIRYSPTDSLMILEYRRRLVGLVVNELVEISFFEPDSIDSLDDLAEGEWAAGLGESRCLAGVAREDDRLIRILDVRALISYDDYEQSFTGPGFEHDFSQESRSLREIRRFMPDASPEEAAVFKERARRLRRRLGEEQEDGDLPLAVIMLGGEYFGVDLEIVRGFSGIRALTPIPGCPEHILGDVNLRGEVLTVLDLNSVLNLPVAADKAAPKLMVVETKGLRVGFQVDEVVDVIHIGPEHISPPPIAGAGAKRGCYKGATRYRDHSIGIVDLERLLADDRLVVDQQL